MSLVWNGKERASKAQVREMWVDFIVSKLQESAYDVAQARMDSEIDEIPGIQRRIASEIADEFISVLQKAAEQLTGKKLPE